MTIVRAVMFEGTRRSNVSANLLNMKLNTPRERERSLLPTELGSWLWTCRELSAFGKRGLAADPRAGCDELFGGLFLKIQNVAICQGATGCLQAQCRFWVELRSAWRREALRSCIQPLACSQSRIKKLRKLRQENEYQEGMRNAKNTRFFKH